jgi:hypothetical protein
MQSVTFDSSRAGWDSLSEFNSYPSPSSLAHFLKPGGLYLIPMHQEVVNNLLAALYLEKIYLKQLVVINSILNDVILDYLGSFSGLEKLA